jgi:GNAT superfamily N-acetyltransferase
MYRWRRYESEVDLWLMQELSSRMWGRAGARAGNHPGDIAWMMFASPSEPERAEDAIQLWFDRADGLVAYAWIQTRGDMDLQLHPDHVNGGIQAEALAWYVDQLPQAVPEVPDELCIWSVEHDKKTIGVFKKAGFDARGWALVHHQRSLDDGAPPEPTVPRGYKLRPVTKKDVNARVAVQRAAWNNSRVTARSYRRVMDAWPYRADLDWVVEAPDGSFAASCLGWFDPVNGNVELEPVGSHPAHRRRGLGRAVCAAALRQARELGARTGTVSCVDSEAPAVALYASLGFKPAARSRRYFRDLPSG